MNSPLFDHTDLGIRPLADYHAIIDARSPREYEQDHLPGAINLPVVDNDEYAVVGTQHRTDPHEAYLIGVAYSLRRMADAIDEVVSRFPRRARLLVYCFRGGKRSTLWTNNLRTIGFDTDQLRGGWKAYRQWVMARLADVPPRFTYHVLCGPTGCGKTRLLDALHAAGEQVLDLEAIARHRGSLIGAIPGVEQPTQKYFDGLLVEAYRGLDPARPIWVEAESKKIGEVQLPTSLFEAMHRSRVFSVDAPMAERVTLWREDYGHFEREPAMLLERLRHLLPLVGGKELAQWHELAESNRMPALFERLMTVHYDPAYGRSISRHYPQIHQAERIVLPDLGRDTLRRVAAELAES